MRRFLYGLSLSRPVLCGRCLLSAFHSRVVRLILYAVCVRRLLPVFCFILCGCCGLYFCSADPRASRFACSVVIWLLPTPHSVLYGCHGFGLWLRGGFCMLCCGGLMEAGFLRYGLASGMRGCASAVRFFALLLHALLFFRSFPHFLLYPTSYFSVVALCARLCAQPRFPPFFSPLSLSSRSFLSSRYLCALFLADGFLPLTS